MVGHTFFKADGCHSDAGVGFSDVAGHASSASVLTDRSGISDIKFAISIMY